MDLLEFELLALPLLGSAIGAAGATVVAVLVDAAAGAGAGAGVDPPPPPPPAGGVVGVVATGAIAAKPVAEYDVIDPSELVPVALNRTNLFTSKLADRYVLVFAPTIAEQSEGRVNDDAPPVVHEYHW